MSGAAQEHWQDVYARRDETQVSWFQEDPAPSLELIALAGAGPSDAIIDVGGGASRLVDALLDRGYTDVTVLDLSENALAAARKRLGARAGAANWIAADAREWQPARAHALWHDRAAFHFLTDEADQRAYLERLRRGLAVGGHAIIATFAPDGPERCSGLPVARHDAASLSALLGPSFELVRALPHDHVTPAGAVQKFQFSLFRRTG
jgi:trans-aconitate methyltransferase